MEQTLTRLISVVVPCYNEEKSVDEMYRRACGVFSGLPAYAFELIYTDDCSTDGTREKIEALCGKDPRVKAVFNARNFGFHRNVFQSLQYGSGEAVFLVFGDLQDPPELLPAFLEQWEKGSQCVVGQRRRSGDGILLRFFRRAYYALMDFLSDSRQIKMMNGFGLYDRSLIGIMKDIDETSPYLKSVIGEYGVQTHVIPYDQSAGLRGKSNFNFRRNYDFAMSGLTSSSKRLMRIATLISLVIAAPSLCFAVFIVIKKLLFWDTYPLGIAALTVGVFCLGSLQLFFTSIVGEYVLSVNERSVKKPRVVAARVIDHADGRLHGQVEHVLHIADDRQVKR